MLRAEPERENRTAPAGLRATLSDPEIRADMSRVARPPLVAWMVLAMRLLLVGAIYLAGFPTAALIVLVLSAFNFLGTMERQVAKVLLLVWYEANGRTPPPNIRKRPKSPKASKDSSRAARSR